ncbi:MAG: sulfite exporter TauE/SafE family protein [Candidatus Eremiobacteraeota bacterium]|nr:sulfite exporter TauE/SafE family protein [Candidatus Eremiobacteraeota bacterium]
MDLRLVVAGFIVGTIAGVSGIGGSSLLAPVLILIFGVNASIAIGTDLIYSVPMKVLAAVTHLRQRTVDSRVIKLLCAGGIPGALAGLFAFGLLRSHVRGHELEQFLRHAIGVVILCAAAAAVLAHVLRPRRDDAPAVPAGEPARLRVIAIGAVVGFLVAMTSIGSGSITLPLLLLALPAVALRSLIGSEIVFAAVMVPVAAAGHVTFGNVDWMMALSLTAGALPGAYLGARLCLWLGDAALRPVIIGVLAVAGAKLL